MSKYKTKKHYDTLIDENNDPVFDPPELKDYMNAWDGETFIKAMNLSPDKSVLEIGVGTGRLAVRVCGLCKSFTGIDYSPKTAERAIKNLSAFANAKIICDDFYRCRFMQTFDVIYSSLTFLHFRRKQTAIKTVFRLLNSNGIFLLSIDKSQNKFIDYGTRKIRVYPDQPEKIEKMLSNAGFHAIDRHETEKAVIFSAKRNQY
ncbi:MAG: class I SAM-dependent methyltransferase [Bacillota bacterium]|nr:MAG: class I SAM-dependent methyltransferase [Bacillota bacterium]